MPLIKLVSLQERRSDLDSSSWWSEERPRPPALLSCVSSQFALRCVWMEEVSVICLCCNQRNEVRVLRVL